MSILVGPFKRKEVNDKASHEEEEDLLMFGYACKLYRDDAKALLENSGQLLIPWMGDHSLMVDRYDVRNRLEDKNMFGLKSNLPHRPTAEEMVLEEQLDSERYLALECDDIRVAEQEEEEEKRKREGSFSAVGFSYNNMAVPSIVRDEDDDTPQLACYPQRLEHPPTSSVDKTEDEEEYVPPVGLIIPNYLTTPATNKIHSVIEKTALFIVKQGAQMEIIIKAKQKFNPFFSFLDHNDDLFPYYRHVKDMLQRGAYVPKQSSPAPPTLLAQDIESSATERNGTTVTEGEQEENVDVGKTEKDEDRTSDEARNKNNSILKENDEDSSDGSDSDSDDDDGYLHPLLMGGGLKSSSKSSTPQPGTRESSPVVETTSAESVSTANTSTAANSAAYTTSSIAFYSKRMSVNSAPVINSKTTLSEASGPPRVATSTSGVSTASGGIYYQPQYDYGGSAQDGYPPSSTSYSGQFEVNGYPSSVTHQDQQRVDASGVQYSDVYSAQPQQQYTQYVQQDGGYYDATQNSTAEGTTQHYDYQAYYYQSADGQYHGSAYSATPPAPPPADIISVVTKTAEYVAKNGDGFERTVIERHAGDPRFGFINPWDKSHAYYQMLKQQYRHRQAYEAYSNQMGWNQNPEMGMGQGAEANNISEPTNLQRLSESGAVSFKLQPPKTTKAFDPSSLVDLGRDSEDVGEESPAAGDEGQRTMVECNGHEDDGAPPSKKPRVEQAKIGPKVEEFLTTVKAMFGTE